MKKHNKMKVDEVAALRYTDEKAYRAIMKKELGGKGMRILLLCIAMMAFLNLSLSCLFLEALHIFFPYCMWMKKKLNNMFTGRPQKTPFLRLETKIHPIGQRIHSLPCHFL